MKLKEIIEVIPDVSAVNGNINVEIKSVAYDSRKTEKGAVFIAISGFDFDGHKFIDDALERGACAVVGEKPIKLEGVPYIQVENSRRALAAISAKFYNYPAEKLKLAGVTGTSGKTTVTHLIGRMLKGSGASAGIIGTIENTINNKKIAATHTTPESLELNKIFSQMVQDNVEYVAMEVSSHSLKLERVYGLKFEVGVFTNLSRDHLDFHKNFEDYFSSKKKLFDSVNQAVINIDDENGRKLLNMLAVPTITYGRDKSADLRAENVKISATGVLYDLVFKGKIYPVSYSTPGMFSVYNSLAAIGACLALGFPVEQLINVLKDAGGVRGRFELVENPLGINVIVDYAHKPDGLKNVLETIRGFCSGRIITVFGCGGDRDRGKRPQMGKIASELSDYVIITSDNPRSENPENIINEIEAGICKNNYEKVIDRRKAIQRAIAIAKKGDTVLIAGKGHETYQIFKDKKIHFDDKEVAKEFLTRS